ncbi:MAG: GNAT family N-acetyltransferase [Pseudonocardia sp.]
MSGIRELRRDDLPAVCALYEQVVRSGSSKPPERLVRYFERTFFDCPWSDPDIPSLVYTDADGAIVGFLGSHVRRVRLDNRPLRLACSGQLVAATDPRHRGAGALLVRRYLAGPQDITITDGATDYMRRIWTGLGGQTHASASTGWAKFLRPTAVGAFLMQRSGHRFLSRSLTAVAPAIDATIRPILRRLGGFLPTEPVTKAEELSAGGLVEQVNDAARRLRLRPDYDTEYLEWLFAELEVVGFRGVPVRHLVRDRGGKVIGWYVYHLAERGIAQVLQVAAPLGDTGAVLDHLFRHADTHGAAAVLGRVEPSLIGELRSRRCLLIPTDWCLVHARDPAVLAVLGTPQALLTRLDGEWWMGHHCIGLGEDRGLPVRVPT